ncbi:thioester reductase domain-containing protein [Chitiniphilus purpureus]|uniref:Thioester reductase domain-containing protein n=1 Tax=Chitiniphilus purpureus TaxID=2981137 RepID=A0ABY6DM79_9NEIS|nr:thioester reductase domain-containing protein [Chitiniphilus sp. CD1]UXY15472.1 thioester reductase domain-containing protein [Chitiniphilus sp. CD1]
MDHHGNMARLDDVLSYWADRQPRRKAYTELDANGAEVDSISYGQLAARARAVAAQLAARATPGQHAILAYPAGIDFIVAFFGCLYAGLAAAPVPLPKRNRPNARLAQMVRAAHAPLLLSTADTLDWMQPVLAREADWPAEVAFVATNEAVPLAPSQPWQTLPGRCALAFTQFTSGSTSLPKGVMISHESCLYNLQMARSVSQAGPDSVFVSWLPHYHDLGLVAHLLHSLYCGSHCVLLAPATFVAQPVQWLRAISRYRGQYTGAPNFAYQLCLDRIGEGERQVLDLSSLRMAINAAEPINPDTVRAFCEGFAGCGFKPAMLLPAYGMAEATVFVASGELEADPVFKAIDPAALHAEGVARPPRPGTAGKTLVGCGTGRLEQRVRIVDPQSGHTAPVNSVGEIWVHGPNVMTGYYDNPEATEAAFGQPADDAARHLRTGDLGFVDEHGELFITGRIKDLIIVNGANFYPQDIEQCVQEAHPALRRGGSAAFGITGDASEQLVLFAEVDKDTAQQAQHEPRLLEPIAERICAAVGGQFELPVAHIVFLKPTQLPRTSSGKVRRQECKQRFLQGHPERLASWPFADDNATDERKVHMLNIEKALQRITEMGPEHLRVFSLLTQILTSRYKVRMADFDVDKSIFFYGIDSLNIIDIHAELEQKLQRQIPTVAFFRANTFIEMIDDIVVGMVDRSQFDRRIAEGATLREEIDAAVAQLADRLAAVRDTSDGGVGRTTLLTGASGFVGVALLKEILAHTDADVVCMVRAADSATALKRIRNTSAKYDLRLPQGFEDRVRIMIGDMSKPRLGLSDEDYARYSEEIDSVYHCAAIDNFYLPYSVMRKTNVLGAIEVLEFALNGKLKPIFYISSCAVSMLEQQEEHTEVTGLVNGYAQSKYVVEQIMLELAQRGYPLANYRLGYLYNLRVQEVADNTPFDALLAQVEQAYSDLDEELIIDADAFENFLSVIPQIGAFPDMDADFDLTPVEYAAKAIVTTTLLPASERQTTYTFYNPKPLKWHDVAAYFKQTHRDVKLVPLPEFLERYEQYIRETNRVSVKLLKSVVSPQLDRQLNTMFRNVKNDHATQFKAWCPPCDARFTHYYVDFAVNG